MRPITPLCGLLRKWPINAGFTCNQRENVYPTRCLNVYPGADAMASDLRYMKPGRGPGSTWFFVYNIPQDLRGHQRFMTSRGKPMTKITESLGTKDPDKAREVRNQRIVYWDRQFRMLRHGPSEVDIRAQAVEVYRATLKAQKELEAEIGWNGSDEDKWEIDGELVPYSRALDHAIEEQAAQEIADYCRRTGFALEPETEPYRRV